jgi:hypothetical protein
MRSIKSKLSPVTCGIPQGSVLGPLLFLIYINGIFSVKLFGTLQCFADDTVLVYGESNFRMLKSKMTADLETLKTFFSNINLSINFTKTKFIIFKRINMKLFDFFEEIEVQNRIVSRVSQYNYLGIVIDENLNWLPHIKHIASKISPIVAAIKKIRHYINRTSLMLLYYAFVHSRFTYLLPIWGTAPSIHFSSLVYIQNRALKFINFRNVLYPTTKLYSNELLSITQLINYESILTVYKIKNNLLKSNFPLIANIEITNRSTRNADKIRLPNYIKQTAQNSLYYNGIKLFNNLPEGLSRTELISKFKRDLKEYVFTNCSIV